jgi:hypothetical protein
MTSGDEAEWQPRGLPPLPPRRHSKHHPNFWLGGVFGSLVVWTCILVFDPLQAVRVVLPYDPLPLLNDIAIQVGSLLLGMLLLVHLLALRPRVSFDDDVLVIDNPLKTYRVPLSHITDVDTVIDYTRLQLLDGQRIVCWGLEHFPVYEPWQVEEIRNRAEATQRSDRVSVTTRWRGPTWFDLVTLVALAVYVVVGVQRADSALGWW